MTLYTFRPPNPPAGTDWTYTVPGIYLERITGITAVLNTPGGPSATAHDRSGNGLDGIYVSGPGPETFAAGIITGDLALQRQNGILAYTAGVNLPDIGPRWHTAWTIVAWFEQPIGTGDLMIFDALDVTNTVELRVTIEYGFTGYHVKLSSNTGSNWTTADGTVPNDGNGHMVAVTFDGTTPIAYVDGAAVAWAATGAQPLGATPLINARIPQGTGFGGGGPQILADEFSTWTSKLTAGNITTLYGARGTFAAYSAAVLALTPRAYYHLNDFVVSTGRTPGLEVTDGTHDVVLIPDGFTAQTTPGPYLYSWIPNAAGSTRDPTGTLTTVEVPDLILPPGYTVGTRTPDIQPTDQWSDIVIWWNNSVATGPGGPAPYVYPPGVKLNYVPAGVTP